MKVMWLNIWRRDGADPIFPESSASSTFFEFICSRLGIKFRPLVSVVAVDSAQSLNMNSERPGACILSVLLPLTVRVLLRECCCLRTRIYVCQENTASFTLQCFCSVYLFILQGRLWRVSDHHTIRFYHINDSLTRSIPEKLPLLSFIYLFFLSVPGQF